jgi:hypothetical protein
MRWISMHFFADFFRFRISLCVIDKYATSIEAYEYRLKIQHTDRDKLRCGTNILFSNENRVFVRSVIGYISVSIQNYETFQ